MLVDDGIPGCKLHNSRGNCKYCHIRSFKNETILSWAQVSGEGSLLLNLFGKKCPVLQESLSNLPVCKRCENGVNVGLMRASSAATAVWELHVIASTALLSFLSSASKCQSSDSDKLPVDVCVCTIAFSSCICKSLCIFLRFKNTCTHRPTLSSCLHARQVVRVCCCRALIFDVKQNWTSVFNYNKIMYKPESNECMWFMNNPAIHQIIFPVLHELTKNTTQYLFLAFTLFAIEASGSTLFILSCISTHSVHIFLKQNHYTFPMLLFKLCSLLSLTHK